MGLYDNERNGKILHCASLQGSFVITFKSIPSPSVHTQGMWLVHLLSELIISYDKTQCSNVT